MTILQWHNTPEQIIEQYTSFVIRSIEKDIEEEYLPKEAPDLIFHHIPLTEQGYDGPSVYVWGVEDDLAWQCEYDETPEWLTIQEIDERNFIIDPEYTDGNYEYSTM